MADAVGDGHRGHIFQELLTFLEGPSCWKPWDSPPQTSSGKAVGLWGMNFELCRDAGPVPVDLSFVRMGMVI